MGSYFFEDGNIKVDLIEKQAKNWAGEFVKVKKPEKPLSSSQLRKFHFEVKTLEEKLKNATDPEAEFKKLKPLIKLIKSKVAYSCRTPGKDRKVPEVFKKYIDEMIGNIDEYADFKAFALCFEAVVGYFYGEGGGNRK